MFKEFKEFIKRGNVMDLAIGVIIGAAFGKIVASLTDDILMPIISLFTGKIDFTKLVRGVGWQNIRHSGGREESRGRHRRLWQLHQLDRQFPYCGVRHLHHGEAAQPDSAATAATAAGGTIAH